MRDRGVGFGGGIVVGRSSAWDLLELIRFMLHPSRLVWLCGAPCFGADGIAESQDTSARCSTESGLR